MAYRMKGCELRRWAWACWCFGVCSLGAVVVLLLGASECNSARARQLVRGATEEFKILKAAGPLPYASMSPCLREMRIPAGRATASWRSNSEHV